MPSEVPLSRRDALAIGTAAAVTAGGQSLSAASAEDNPWIDAHSHIWPPDTRVFKLAPGMTVADLAPRSFTDDELLAVARPHGVGRVVLIQHTLFHGFDNSCLIDAWQRKPDLFRVVGMVDDLRPNCGKAMRQLFQQGVTGFRITPRRGITDWLRTDGMTDMWKTAAETRQSMCCLIDPDQLPAVDAACVRHPQTPVVIDHFARIGVDGIIRNADLDNLCQLARHPHTTVKISAYYALGSKRPPHAELVPMIRRLYETFGPDRLMWASDCPYQLTGPNTYGTSIELIKSGLDFISSDDRQKLLRTTAEQTFFFA